MNQEEPPDGQGQILQQTLGRKQMPASKRAEQENPS
jgi:hypothetical protein